MNAAYYLREFQNSAMRLDEELLAKKKLELSVGITMDSVFLKLYKRAWCNQKDDPLNSPSRIFFSIWINDSTLAKERIYYNIHALKLRQLNGYSIESRKFAESFRADFKNHQVHWPNVSTKFGPLTLMEGWFKVEPDNFSAEITQLASQFLEIDYLIEQSLLKFKK